jgi:hypothetical protein
MISIQPIQKYGKIFSLILDHFKILSYLVKILSKLLDLLNNKSLMIV